MKHDRVWPRGSARPLTTTISASWGSRDWVQCSLADGHFAQRARIPSGSQPPAEAASLMLTNDEQVSDDIKRSLHVALRCSQQLGKLNP